MSKLIARAFRRSHESEAGRKAVFETLEPRLLLSASPAPDYAAIDAADAAVEAVLVERTSPLIVFDQGTQSPTNTSSADAAVAASFSAQPSAAELDALFAEAAARMDYDGAPRIEVTDLQGPYLAQSDNDRIRLDIDATGYGWFIDPTPADDEEFAYDAARGEWIAPADSAAAGKIDLLSTLMHEIGHLQGASHADANADAHDVMQAHLGPGLRKFHPGELAFDPIAAIGDAEVLSSGMPVTHDIQALTITPTVSWIGTNGSWETASNWSTGLVPGVNDDVLIDTAAATHTIS
ncbi:MAG: LEPR-XLL domain-containing protein, partial [Burkholderiales bacterium]